MRHPLGIEDFDRALHRDMRIVGVRAASSMSKDDATVQMGDPAVGLTRPLAVGLPGGLLVFPIAALAIA